MLRPADDWRPVQSVPELNKLVERDACSHLLTMWLMSHCSIRLVSPACQVKNDLTKINSMKPEYN